jgi:hypothetical protein
VQANKKQLDQILSPEEKAELKDAPGPTNAASTSGSNNTGGGNQPAAGGQTNFFGSSNSVTPANAGLVNSAPTQQAPASGADSGAVTNAGAQIKSAAALAATPDGNLSPLYDEGTAKDKGPMTFPRDTQQKPLPSQITPLQKALDANPDYQQAVKDTTQANANFNDATQQLHVLEANPPSSQNTDAINAQNQKAANALNAIDEANRKKNTIIKRIIILPAPGSGQSQPPPPPTPSAPPAPGSN